MEKQFNDWYGPIEQEWWDELENYIGYDNAKDASEIVDQQVRLAFMAGYKKAVEALTQHIRVDPDE